MRTTSRYLVALIAALGLLPVALDGTIVNVAIVPIANALHSTVDAIQWIFLGYLLANAAIVPLSGYLGNRFGVKRLFLAGLALFTLSSLLCGVAPSEPWLVAFRAVQGIGGGLLLPLGMAIALQPFAKEERARATALVAVPVLLAPVAGPIVGGLLIDNLSWQSIFFVNVPIGLAVLALGWWILPDDRDAQEANRVTAAVDALGLLLSMAGVAVLIYGCKLVSQTDPQTRTAANPQGTIHGWGYWPVWALLALGLALLGLFTYRALRVSRDPILDLRLFASRDFAAGNLAIWVASIIVFGVLFLVPVYLQQVRVPQLSPVRTGVALLPMSIATVIGVILGSALYGRLGARVVVLAGTVLLGIGCWQLRGITPSTSTGDLTLPLGFVGLSTTLILVPTQTMVLEALSGEALNKATSLVNATKLLWASIGSAILVTIFIQRTTVHATALATTLPPAARAQLAAQAATSGLDDVFTLLLWCTLVLVAVALFLPGRKGEATVDAPQALPESPRQAASAR